MQPSVSHAILNLFRYLNDTTDFLDVDDEGWIAELNEITYGPEDALGYSAYVEQRLNITFNETGLYEFRCFSESPSYFYNDTDVLLLNIVDEFPPPPEKEDHWRTVRLIIYYVISMISAFFRMF